MQAAPSANPPRERRRDAASDLAVVALVTLVSFTLSSLFEVREWMTEMTHPLEPYQVDELPLTFAVLALALAWFSWRRWRHAEEELRLRVQAQAALTEREAQNRLLSQKYLLVQEEERRNLARELHDELGQYLNAIKLDAVSIRDVARGRQPEIETSANGIIELSGHVYDAVRGIMQRLRPAALDALGLEDAVGHLVGQWQRRNAALECRLNTSGDLADLGEVVNITVYRLVQECLTNIAKHARARHVTVSLQRSGEGLVRVSVSDDGCGVDLAARRTGLGLVGLRERVEALQGQLRIDSRPGGGFRLEALVPGSASVETSVCDEALETAQDAAGGAARAAVPLARPTGRVHAKPQP